MRREHGRRFLSLDPNVRPGLIPDRAAYTSRLEGWVSLMDLVKVSRADLAWLYPDRSLAATAADWLAMGPALVAVTMGTDGAAAFAPGRRVDAHGVSVSVADTVGAGDAFMSGLLGWLHDHGALGRDRVASLDDDALRDALLQGNRVAAITCARVGAEPPTRAELQAFPTPA
jgi:fructokinase